MKTLGKFREMGAVIEIKPVSRQGDSMDVHVRARIGRKQFVRSLSVSMLGNFEHDLRSVLMGATDEVVELMKSSAPEIFEET